MGLCCNKCCLEYVLEHVLLLFVKNKLHGLLRVFTFVAENTHFSHKIKVNKLL